MSLKLIICFIFLLTTVSSVEDNSIAPNVQENIKKEPVPIFLNGDNWDPKNDAVVKRKLPWDIIKDAIIKTLQLLYDIGEKLKAWLKSLDCTNVTSKFVRCKYNKFIDSNNTDKWRATISKTPIPDAPTRQSIDDEPETIMGSLRDWLVNTKKFLITALNKTKTYEKPALYK